MFLALNVPCHVPLHSKTTWGNSHLCFAKRVLVANDIIFSSMWYLATCWNPNPRMTYQIEGLIRKKKLLGGGALN
jgi:hypothetical protein